MSSSSPASLLDVDLQPGKPAVLRVSAAGDALGWVAEHREALRAVLAEHGSLLVRGLGLRDAAQTGAVFQRLTTGLMVEREAFGRAGRTPGVCTRRRSGRRTSRCVCTTN